VPVLVLSGFLGAGKTTLLQRVLTGNTGLRLAVLVNDMAEINIDAQMVSSTTAATATQERVVALTNGCICCTLRDDLLTEVSRMAGASVRGQLPLLTRLQSI
jgi:G3E family GTPase